MNTTGPRLLSGAAQAVRLFGATLVFGLAASLFLQSWRYGLLVTVSFALHELGHILALSRHGIPWEVRLSLLGVGTVTPLEARRRLGHFANSQIHLAGPGLNLAQALVALGGYAVSSRPADRANWLIVANFASLLVILNLLPMGILSDGGKFIRRLFASLSARSEEGVTWSMLFWLLSLTWLMIVTWGDVLRTLGTLVVAVWFVVVMLGEQQREAPVGASAGHKMTRPQGILLFSSMATALLWATGITALTPFWLTLAHAETMTYNLVVAVATLQRSWPLPLALVIPVAIAFAAGAHRRRRR